MNYTVTIPLKIYNAIIDRGAYYSLYLENIQDGMCPKSAYENTEAAINRYGAKRYTSYHSFRKNIWRMPDALKAYKRKKAFIMPSLEVHCI